MSYNPKEHHRKSIRLKEFDYSTPWWYYVTICTYNRIKLFGEVKNTKMHLNEFGLIVKKCWEEIPIHFPNAELDYYVVMPNHFHGNIIINKTLESKGKACLALTNVSKFSKPISGSFPTIVGSFKSAVTKQINLLRGTTGKSVWQRNYYEHIIRNEIDLFNIRKYIELNPLKWELDEYYR